MNGDPIQLIAAQAKRRSHRFSDRAWEQWLHEGGLKLAQALKQTPWSAREQEAVFESALTLAAEGVSCGYLPYRTGGTAQSWFDWVWTEHLPRRLPLLAAPQALQELVELWNVSESLELGESWKRTLFFLFRQHLTPTISLRAFLASIESQLDPKALTPLPENTRQWKTTHLTLSDLSPYALPGRPIFVAPRLVAIPVRETETVFFFLLSPAPVALGVGSLKDLERRQETPPLEVLPFLSQHRIGELATACSNPWFWVGVPSLSQRIYFAWSEATATPTGSGAPA